NLRAGPAPPPGQVLAQDRLAQVGVWHVQALDALPPPVRPDQNLLPHVLSQMAVTGEQVGEAQQDVSTGDDELVETVRHQHHTSRSRGGALIEKHAVPTAPRLL